MAALAGACQPSHEPPVRDPATAALVQQLADAPSAAAAAGIEQRLLAQWRRTGSPTADILLERSARAAHAGEFERARLYLDEAEAVAPNVAEIHHRRAMIAAADDNLPEALVHIEATLALEPRHFAALMSLGALYERLGQSPAALEAYRSALEAHPHLEAARQAITRLSPRVEGDDI